jgi:hypothetical protein
VHRLELHKAGMVEASLAGSSPLEERSKLLKAYRARWESLYWTRVTRLRSNAMRCPQFVGTTLVYAGIQRASVIYYHRLPFGGTPWSWREDHQLGLNRGGTIKVFSAHFETNLLAVLMEESIDYSQ